MLLTSPVSDWFVKTGRIDVAQRVGGPLMAPDNQAIEWAQFSVTCSKCSASGIITVGDKRLSMPCPGCGSAIDLKSPEATHARQEAAARAFNQSLKNAGG